LTYFANLEKNHQDFDITIKKKQNKTKKTHDYNHSRDCFNLKEKNNFFQGIKKDGFQIIM
jgi:hypothetical protein